MKNTNMITEVRTARPTPTSLATALSAAILHGDAHLAAQLAWRLIFQPDCPLRMQAHAVLVHSALSLRLGARPQLIESNLRATIHRLAGGTELTRLALRGHMAPWKLEALAQLQAALRSLRQHGDIPFRVHIPEIRLPSKRSAVPERLVEGLDQIDLDAVPKDVDALRDPGRVEQEMVG